MSVQAPRRQGTVGYPVDMDPARSFRRGVPVSTLEESVTPVSNVYVVAHVGVAHVDVASWRLTIDGMVDRPLALDYDYLRRLPAQDVTAVLECFGNPLEPQVPVRRAANVRWRGASLAELLTRAGVNPEATAVWLEGLDSGTFGDAYVHRYIKDIPLSRALERDVLVAYEMNGAPLTPEHGFPARIFVPGYFGTNAVKWVTRITAAATRRQGLFTTQLYTRRADADGSAGSQPAREMDVQSVIVRPHERARLRPGPQQLAGWAWSAYPITGVEVSTDCGYTWSEARLERPESEWAWRRFAFDWQAAPGIYGICSRARDERGRVQTARDRNAIHAITVTVG